MAKDNSADKVIYISKLQEGHRGPKGPAPVMPMTKVPVSAVPATAKKP